MASPYANSTPNGGGSAYAGATPNGSGSAYAGSTPNYVSASPPPAGGGGFWHDLVHNPGRAVSEGAHWTAGKVGLAAHDLKAIPGGLVQVANTAVVRPWENLVTTGHPYAHGQGQKIDELTAQVANQTVQSVAHPLRDPFQTLLTVAPAAHALGAGVVRASAAADAARAGEGVTGVAKALSTRAEMPPRFLRIGGAQVPLPTSKAPLPRAAQAVHDLVVQRAIDTNPEGRLAGYGMRRAEGSLAETERYRGRLRDVPANMLDQAARRLTRGGAHFPGLGAPRLQRVEQAALELTSMNTTPAEAATYHLVQAAKGVSPGLNRQVAKLYGKVLAAGYLTHDGAGNVAVDASRYPRLAEVDKRLAVVQQRGDEILADHGIRTREALQARVNAPGRIRAGATYEKPTPGKVGVSPALVRATAERDRLATLHGRALDKEAKWLAESKARDLGPLSEQDAKARLAQLDAWHRALLDRIVPETSEYGGDLSKREQLFRNYENSHAGKGNRIGASKLPTVKAEEFANADTRLRDAIAKNPDTPAAARAAQLLDERDKLRAAVNARAEAAFGGEQLAPLPRAAAAKHISVPPASNPFRNRIVRLGIRLEAANEKVGRLQAAAEKRLKPTGIVGGKATREGRGFVSYKTTAKNAPRSPSARGRGPVVGAPRSPIGSEPFTGRGIEAGKVPSNVTEQAAQHLRSLNRFVNTSELRNRIAETGSEVRRTSSDVLIRVPGEKAGKITDEINALLGKERQTVDDERTLSAALGDYKAYLLDKAAASAEDGIGTKAPDGYRWVDERMLRTITEEPMPRSNVGKTGDWLNSLVTTATVYLKPGHVGTRVLTNLATNVIQGSWLHAVQNRILWNALSEEDRMRALAAAGQHGFQAMPHQGTGAMARFARAGTNWWARHADLAFRFNSIAYEARKAGFDTPEKFSYLLSKLEDGGKGLTPHEWARMDNVAKTANRANIAYDRLSPFERRHLARYVWFYPFTKGATMFLGHTIAEHPFKAAGLANAGALGRETQQRELGNLPSYEQGLFKLAGGSMPLVSDFSTFSPFANPADLMQVASAGQASSFLNPVYGALVQLLTRQNQYGQHSNTPVADALAALFSPTPEAQIVTGYLNRSKPQATHMFPASPELAGTETPLLRGLVGPALPRRLNLPAAQKAYERERTGR